MAVRMHYLGDQEEGEPEAGGGDDNRSQFARDKGRTANHRVTRSRNVKQPTCVRARLAEDCEGEFLESFEGLGKGAKEIVKFRREAALHAMGLCSSTRRQEHPQPSKLIIQFCVTTAF